MTGSQVIDAEEDRHKLVVEYKDALQPADFYHNFKQRGIRSVQLIPYLEFDDRGDLTAASVTAERAVTARRATGIACARTLGRRRQTACFVRAIRRFILTPHRICG